MILQAVGEELVLLPLRLRLLQLVLPLRLLLLQLSDSEIIITKKSSAWTLRAQREGGREGGLHHRLLKPSSFVMPAAAQAEATEAALLR